MQSLGSLARIKWEIQEDDLIARLTYDRIQDSDYYGAQTTNYGQIVAEFNISSHFDIIRDYNPQTGEQLNVIVENTTDRPWYEREYFRVDWSQNLVTDAYGLRPVRDRHGRRRREVRPARVLRPGSDATRTRRCSTPTTGTST